MDYSEEDLHTLTPEEVVEFVRSRPKMFVRGAYKAWLVAGQLAQDALILGASQVVISRHDSWHIVSADIDWLSAPARCPVSPREAFFGIVAFPEAGVNCMRAEILLTAYAAKVISATPQDRLVIKGDIEDEIWPHLLPRNLKRSVAFAGGE